MTFFLLTRISEIAQIDLRQTLADHWPGLEWLRAPALLATGHYLGVFRVPHPATAGQISKLLRRHGVADADVRRAPTLSTITDLVDAIEQRPETD